MLAISDRRQSVTPMDLKILRRIFAQLVSHPFGYTGSKPDRLLRRKSYVVEVFALRKLRRVELLALRGVVPRAAAQRLGKVEALRPSGPSPDAALGDGILAARELPPQHFRHADHALVFLFVYFVYFAVKFFLNEIASQDW
jgi:hypothetical protein